MENNEESLSNPWESLPTATSFDGGNDIRPTARLGNGTSNQNHRHVVNTYSASTSLLIGSLIQQLCLMFEADATHRNKLYFAICEKLYELKLIDNSYSMIEFEPMRNQYRQALYQLFAVARAATGCDNSILRRIPSPLLITERSRYNKEFEEISLIASGGFGNVFKALHRLDGIEYAIKKIIVRSDRVKSIVERLDEVKTLARLNHANIVPYKGAWIEPTLPSTSFRLISPEQSSESNGSASKGKESSTENSDATNSKGNSKGNSGSNGSAGGRNSTDHSNSISFRSEEGNGYGEDKTKTSVSYEERSNDKMLLPYVSQTNKRYTTLYIQMALCEKTLQRWMDERVGTTPQAMIVAIWTQIISGLDYIHSRDIVHHDIKLQIQLGDFGLACPLRRENHGSVFGTHMYAAPEQLQGKCDPKSDVYSLGIVLLELLVQTKTRMERIEIINGLKRGQLPTALAATYPRWAHVVSQLVQIDPKKRPTTNQLLLDLNEDKDTIIARLKNDLSERDKLIEVLEDRISRLQQQITKHDNNSRNM
ncbi:eukaryotic translation initiation factor 2-alpha kinase 1-like isoform X2 [Ceratina calcarata]|uniref:non-specific serine/threonine protein kinase n=1 Tax=Ceratina calcarata TaxID=156304 RepID=A0AAJ7WDB7_9HYME|nr:eukaryotic translation initiation factor 2-alpha kinase 1-like isoform X2 [Ceratina calcarata]